MCLSTSVSSNYELTVYLQRPDVTFTRLETRSIISKATQNAQSVELVALQRDFGLIESPCVQNKRREESKLFSFYDYTQSANYQRP